MEIYVDNIYKLYIALIEFLEDSYEMNTRLFEEIANNLKNQKIEEDHDLMEEFLQLISHISNHHHRDHNFNRKIEQILHHYKDQIKQTLSNIEIFDIFQNNKIIIYFLLKNDIMTITDYIYIEILNKLESNGNKFCHFFYPELEKFIGKDSMKTIKDELLLKDENIFKDYEIKRQEGVNDSYICTLIRQDSVEEFITFVNRNNYLLSSQITPSIFETNLFLIENKNTTLIEYSAFYGSIQIFRYLMMNQVKLTPSLWLYTIHSKNAELIHLLEYEKVSPPFNYFYSLTESIKCHHNDIAEYIGTNLFNQTQNNFIPKEKIFNCYLKYHNYIHFKTNSIDDYEFIYLSMYNYKKFVSLLLKTKEKYIKSRIYIQYLIAFI